MDHKLKNLIINQFILDPAVVTEKLYRYCYILLYIHKEKYCTRADPKSSKTNN
jgi:hypothetical protein